MKNTLTSIYLIFIPLLFLFFSCGKTTKGKLSHEWKVTHYKATTNITSFNLDATKTEIRDQNSFRIQDNGVNGLPDANIKGEVIQNTFTIHKDGTWESVYIRKHQVNPEDNSPTIGEFTKLFHKIVKKNGIWQFVKKDKTSGFKKHERLLFTTLEKHVEINNTTYIDVNNLKDTSYYSSKETTQYNLGTQNKTWIVTESKQNLLQLKFESKSTETSGAETHQSHIVIEKTLEN